MNKEITDEYDEHKKMESIAKLLEAKFGFKAIKVGCPHLDLRVISVNCDGENWEALTVYAYLPDAKIVERFENAGYSLIGDDYA